MKKYMLSTLFILAWVQCASAATYYVDFGAANNTTTGNWNNITANQTGQYIWPSQSITGLVDANGLQTGGINLEAVATGTIANNNDGGSLSPYSTSYPLSANQDFIYFDSGDLMTITLSNLNNTLTYDLKLFSSRDASGSRITQYDLTTGTIAGSTQRLLEAVDNKGNTVTFASITPDINNEIAFTVQRQSGSSYGYINVLEITAIPEPGSIALLVLGGLSFFVVLRRRK
ncbi:PEP-CTERM sorting domain-containing protein [Kiritimatiellota bacterium B12222]|nr:PEP-CTERM sorting domain-containing protein [Kiritimatiellota bacterium B12222]